MKECSFGCPSTDKGEGEKRHREQSSGQGEELGTKGDTEIIAVFSIDTVRPL